MLPSFNTLEGRLGEPLHLVGRGAQLAAVAAVSVVGGQGGLHHLGRRVRRYLADQHLTLVYPSLGPALRSQGVIPRQLEASLILGSYTAQSGTGFCSLRLGGGGGCCQERLWDSGEVSMEEGVRNIRNITILGVGDL